MFRQKSLRTVPNLLVVSLTLGDFLFVLFCVPFGAVAYSVENYPFSTFYCRFENFIINLSLGVSVFSLLALSADRYKIIVKPFSTHTKDPSIRLKLVVIAIWVVAACLALPEAINSGKSVSLVVTLRPTSLIPGLIFDTISQGNNRTLDLIYCWSPNKLSSLNNAQFMIIRQISRLIIYYLMPLTFISVFYILIAKKLFQSRDSIYSPVRINDETRPIKPRMPVPVRASFHQNETTTKLHQDSRARKQLRARKKVAKTVLFLCLVFFLCWLPKQIHDLYWYVRHPLFRNALTLLLQVHRRSRLFIFVELLLANQQNHRSRPVIHVLVHEPVRPLLSLVDLSSLLQALSLFLYAIAVRLEAVQREPIAPAQVQPRSNFVIDEQLDGDHLLRLESRQNVQASS